MLARQPQFPAGVLQNTNLKKAHSMVTFEVTPNLKANDQFPPYRGMQTPEKFFQATGKKEKIEASGGDTAIAWAGARQGLIDATFFAFNAHLPLVLSPDSIWLTISQGVARHVTENAETLREKFVKHKGKKALMVERNSFVRGNPDNDWPGVWEEFSQQIKERTVPKTYERLISDFSTTSLLEKAISNLTLMDTMSGYFSYGVSTSSGIPKVTLLGTPEDWDKLYQKARAISEYDLEWWTVKMLPVLNQFREASKNKPDQEWWQSFYHWNSMSGGDYLTGHILAFFPFVETLKGRNELAYIRRTDWGNGSTDQIPGGTVKVPFTWYYHGQKLEMFFKGGLVGAKKLPEGIQPACAWAVVEPETK